MQQKLYTLGCLVQETSGRKKGKGEQPYRGKYAARLQLNYPIEELKQWQR
jgi:hypothetical protein